jgi:hypothetical protein
MRASPTAKQIFEFLMRPLAGIANQRETFVEKAKAPSSIAQGAKAICFVFRLKENLHNNFHLSRVFASRSLAHYSAQLAARPMCIVASQRRFRIMRNCF